MRRLTTYEHAWLKIDVAGDLSTQDAEILAQMETHLPAGCIEWGRHRVKFRQFCGLVQLGQLQIEILPKTDQQQTPTQARTDLLAMLATCTEFKDLPALPAALATDGQHLLDIFIQHFIRLLEHELRQGLLVDYQQREDTLGQVRGQIDLVRQQREHGWQAQRLACRFHELVIDIPVNRLLHTCLLHLMRLVSVPALGQQLRRLRQRFHGVACLPPQAPLLEACELNRMQRRYAPLVSLARLLLQGRYFNVHSGQQTAFSLLFDMNRLFEGYTQALLKPVVRAWGGHLCTQGPRRALVKDAMGNSHVWMRPDVSVWHQDSQPSVVMDVKWKILPKANALRGLAIRDLYQIATYASAYGCQRVFLLYPQQAHLQTPLQLELVTGVLLQVIPVPLQKEEQKAWRNMWRTL